LACKNVAVFLQAMRKISLKKINHRAIEMRWPSNFALETPGAKLDQVSASRPQTIE